MKLQLIYPSWPRMPNQPEFHLPPHGPVCFAAAVPDDVEIAFTDEHLQPIDFDWAPDLVAISCMLTCQIPRAWEIADQFREIGVPVIFGGIGTMLHAVETQAHADAVFLGEAEGKFAAVIRDLAAGRLRKVYDHFHDYPDMRLIGRARRDILDRNLYNYRGVQMVDLIHASRGCRFNCFPCCTPFLGGRRFRPRDIDSVVSEIRSIDNDRFFFVDNSLAQDDDWEKALFRAITPLGVKWISHPIRDEDEILDLAAKAGCWYVYQAIFDTSDHIRRRIQRLKDRGIGVEGTVILGMDDHDESEIKRLVDFLLDIDLDLAEFTILTPFPHTPIRARLEGQGRLLHNDWIRYTGADTVFRPARMSVDKLNELYQYAWDTFYGTSSKELRYAKLFLKSLQTGEEKSAILSRQPKRQKWGQAAIPPSDKT